MWFRADGDFGFVCGLDAMRGVVLWLLAVWVLFRVVALSVGCLGLLGLLFTVVLYVGL